MLPICLNATCATKGIFHYMQDCNEADKPEKERSLKENHMKKKKRKERFGDASGHSGRRKRGGISTVKDSTGDSNDHTTLQREDTALISAIFCDGCVECEESTDQWSDVNLVLPEIFDLIHLSHPDLPMNALTPPVKYNAVAIGSVVSCDRSFKSGTKLQIRTAQHSSSAQSSGWSKTSMTTTRSSGAHYWKRLAAAIRTCSQPPRIATQSCSKQTTSPMGTMILKDRSSRYVGLMMANITAQQARRTQPRPTSRSTSTLETTKTAKWITGWNSA